MSEPRYVSVIGASRATPELAAKAEELGELLARARPASSSAAAARASWRPSRAA